MGKKKFSVRLEGIVEVEIDDTVINAIDDSWRKSFYPLRSKEDIAEHIVFAMVVRGFSFDQLDGFAGLDSNAVRIKEDGDWETSAVELLPKQKKVAAR